MQQKHKTCLQGIKFMFIKGVVPICLNLAINGTAVSMKNNHKDLIMIKAITLDQFHFLLDLHLFFRWHLYK